MSKQHTVVRVTKYNLEEPAAAVEVAQAPVPEPGQGQVLIRLQLRPVDPADIFSVQGVYPGFQPEKLPAVPGLEGTGVVERNGPGASKFKPGKDGHGTWQQYICVGEDVLLAVPDGVSDEAAAQFLINPVTCFGFFHELSIPKGEWLLSNAAASTLGRMIIQMAKHYGVKTINLIRSAHHRDDLLKLGADELVVTSDEDVVERVKQITGGKGAYASLECVGGDATQKLVQATRDNGQVVIYGAMQEFSFTSPIPDILFRGVKIVGFWLNPFLMSVGDRRQQVLEEVMRMLESGVISPHSGEHFPLEKVADAIKETGTAKRGGKCFLEG